MPHQRSPLGFDSPEPGFRGRFAGSAEGFRSERPRDEAGVADLVERVQQLAKGKQTTSVRHR